MQYAYRLCFKKGSRKYHRIELNFHLVSFAHGAFYADYS